MQNTAQQNRTKQHIATQNETNRSEANQGALILMDASLKGRFWNHNERILRKKDRTNPMGHPYIKHPRWSLLKALKGLSDAVHGLNKALKVLIKSLSLNSALKALKGLIKSLKSLNKDLKGLSCLIHLTYGLALSTMRLAASSGSASVSLEPYMWWPMTPSCNYLYDA